MSTEPFAPNPSPLLRRLGNGLGWLCVVTTLALSAPGVVLRANGEGAPQAGVQRAAPVVSGPGCSVAERSGESQVVYLGRVIEQLRADAAQNPDPSDAVIPLNNSGFSYPVAPSPPAPPAAADPAR